MSGTQKNIDLLNDLKEISEKAIQSFELSYEESGHSNLHDPLLRWCDFLLRYIAPAKRIILKSDRFPANISDGARAGLQRIEGLFTAGGDVNPYQSKTLTLFNDTSGKKEKKRTDGLWADWGIHHLHLSSNPVDPAKKYSDRAEWVLFLKVYNDAVLFIDIKQHDKSIEPDLFSQKDLIETLIRNWPQAAEMYEMKGVTGLANNQPFTDADIAKMRSNGINLPFEMGGKVYAPIGMGMTSAVTAMRVTMFRDRIFSYAKEIEEKFMDEDGSYMKELKSGGVSKPEFELYMFDDGGLGIAEINISKAWQFPRETPNEPNDLFCLFNNSFMPEWAGPVVAQYWKDNP